MSSSSSTVKRRWPRFFGIGATAVFGCVFGLAAMPHRVWEPRQAPMRVGRACVPRRSPTGGAGSAAGWRCRVCWSPVRGCRVRGVLGAWACCRESVASPALSQASSAFRQASSVLGAASSAFGCARSAFRTTGSAFAYARSALTRAEFGGGGREFGIATPRPRSAAKTARPEPAVPRPAFRQWQPAARASLPGSGNLR